MSKSNPKQGINMNADNKTRHVTKETAKFEDGAQRESIKSSEQFNAELSQLMLKKTERLKDQEIDLALRVVEAREFLDWHCNTIKTEWIDWIQQANKILEEMRQV